MPDGSRAPIGLLGGGTIGGGWAATYLARRRPVLLTDPAPSAWDRRRTRQRAMIWKKTRKRLKNVWTWISTSR